MSKSSIDYMADKMRMEVEKKFQKKMYEKTGDGLYFERFKKPIRIQRKRTKGWKMPENTVYVGRGSKWGNPFKVGQNYKVGHIPDNESAVHAYRRMVKAYCLESEITQLKGKNLACWCKLSDPCHADVLLEIANG